MSEEIFFHDPEALPLSSKFIKPNDDFSTAQVLPNTVFYLATILPHTDRHTIHGPVTSFGTLLPKIEAVVSNSPSAIDKYEALKFKKEEDDDDYDDDDEEDNEIDKKSNITFLDRGFKTFNVKGQRGVYTVLKVLREVNASVFETLPAPVYTLITTGPLSQPPTSTTSSIRAATVAKPTGFAATTRLVGSFVEPKDAQVAARRAMRDLTSGEENVKVTETWEKGGKGAGMLIAMGRGVMWQVRVGYEDQAVQRAWAGLSGEGIEVGWRF